jgi:hypothetical protein
MSANQLRRFILSVHLVQEGRDQSPDQSVLLWADVRICHIQLDLCRSVETQW